MQGRITRWSLVSFKFDIDRPIDVCRLRDGAEVSRGVSLDFANPNSTSLDHLVDKIWDASGLFFPPLTRLTRQPVDWPGQGIY